MKRNCERIIQVELTGSCEKEIKKNRRSVVGIAVGENFWLRLAKFACVKLRE